MSLEVKIYEHETHLLIKATGQYSLANLHELFDRVRKESENRANQRVLLDVTEVAGAIPVLDMLVLGEREAEAGTVAVRHRKHADMGAKPLEQFIEEVTKLVETKSVTE